MPTFTAAARAFGRLGGQSRSPKKLAAVTKNLKRARQARLAKLAKKARKPAA